MADFCNQCLHELGLWQGTPDFPDHGPLEENYGWGELCEGCGFIIIDRNGNCITEKHERANHGPHRLEDRYVRSTNTVE